MRRVSRIRRARHAAVAVLASVGAAASFAACVDDFPDNVHDAGARDAYVPDVGARDASTNDVGCAPVDAGPIDDAQVALGLSLIKALKCQSCHGQLLAGNANGIPAPSGTAYPPNLTPDPATGLGCWTNEEILRAILYGERRGTMLCAPMPAFGDGGLDAVGAEAVIQFLRTLPPAEAKITPTTCARVADAGDASSEDSGPDGADATADAGASDAAEGGPTDGGAG